MIHYRKCVNRYFNSIHWTEVLEITPSLLRQAALITPLAKVKLLFLGRWVAQLEEQAAHIQRLCPCCSGARFDSTCGPLLHVIPPLSPLFPVHSSAVLS